MKIRGDVSSVNLSTGERKEFLVGDGEVRQVPAALHKEGAGGALDAAAIRNATIEEIASFAETHYCIIDANSLGGYKTCERPKHPNEPFARAIRALMDCSGGRAATDAPKETPRGA